MRMYEAYSDYDGDGVICIDLQALFMAEKIYYPWHEVDLSIDWPKILLRRN